MRETKTVLVCGSRNWADREPIRDALRSLPAVRQVIHGAAQGADRIAAGEAMVLGIDTVAYVADWVTHGRAAGPIRNSRMLKDGKPDLVLAFRLDGPSPGTDDMIRKAQAAGIPVLVINA